MKNDLKKFRTIAILAVLPLVATAAASAQQWMTVSSPIGAVAVKATKLATSGRMHTIALNRGGTVEGRVAAIESNTREFQGLDDLTVFFLQNGKIARQTKTSIDGSFVVEGLVEGTYSFVATGDAGFVAYGVQVVADGAGTESNIMEAGVVSPNLSLVKELLGQQVPQQVSDAVAASEKQFNGKLIGANRVQLDGKNLKGRLTALIGGSESVEGTKVALYKDGVSVAEIIADDSGEFTIENVEPGIYEFVANGSAGFAAISFEAINALDADSDEMAVSLQEPMLDSGYLNVGLAAQADGGVVSDSMTYSGGDYSSTMSDAGMVSVGEDFACGGSCGASAGACDTCGGGGGGGGGGMVGGRGLRWLLLGAAIAIPLALSTDSTPVSPSS
jgi:hypothetical protein